MLAMDEIKSRLEGKSLIYIPVNGGEPVEVNIKGGKVFNVAGEQVRLVGVRWTYLLELFNKQHGIEEVIADPMKDVIGEPAVTSTSGKKTSNAAPKERKPRTPASTEAGKNTRESITYWTTSAQKETVLAIHEYMKLNATDEVIASAMPAMEKLVGQWSDEDRKKSGSMATLSLDECVLLGKVYSSVLDKKAQFKSLSSLMAKTEWATSLKFE